MLVMILAMFSVFAVWIFTEDHPSWYFLLIPFLVFVLGIPCMLFYTSHRQTATITFLCHGSVIPLVALILLLMVTRSPLAAMLGVVPLMVWPGLAFFVPPRAFIWANKVA